MSVTEREGTGQTTGAGTPAEVVSGFLQAMADGDMDAAVAAVADDLVYSNVSLPTIRTKERFARGAKSFTRARLSFDVRIHKVAENGATVMTERTDVLSWGPYRSQFWVCGVFEVHDGKITLWRDYFDWQNVVRASLRGLLGVLIPPLRARFKD
jgi:limonene-1,2-epoxide hydrolase